MGLDNGIILKYPKKISGCNNSDEFIDKILPEYLKERRESFFSYEEEDDMFIVEFAYWRKCWNVRNNVLNILNVQYEEQNNGEFEVLPQKITEIVDMIIQYIKYPNLWEDEYDDGNTIWEYEVIKRNLVHQISSLCWLQEFLKIDNHAEAIFYDSY